jgi:hypothetical protein
MIGTDERSVDHRQCWRREVRDRRCACRRGLACIDDEAPFLARFVDSDGAAVPEEPEQPDFACFPGIAGNGTRPASTS